MAFGSVNNSAPPPNPNLFQRGAQFAGNWASTPFRYPLQTAYVAAPFVAGAVANNLAGNPIGGTIDAVTDNAWNLRPDDDAVVATTPGATQAVAIPSPLDQAATSGERAIAVQYQLNKKAEQQAYEQAMAMQLLGGYLDMIQQNGR